LGRKRFSRSLQFTAAAKSVANVCLRLVQGNKAGGGTVMRPDALGSYTQL